MSEQNLDRWLDEMHQNPEYLDEKTLILAIAQRVSTLIAEQPDLLFSHLYRLDVREDKIQEVLAAGGDVPRALAILIVDRQKLRMETKNKYRSNEDPGTASTFNPDDY